MALFCILYISTFSDRKMALFCILYNIYISLDTGLTGLTGLTVVNTQVLPEIEVKLVENSCK